MSKKWVGPQVSWLAGICREAGAAILDVYAGDFAVEHKRDSSPLTEADLRAHRIILRRLKERFPDVPVLSEESADEAPYELRRQWSEFWLVDPLDGTKEFVKRNGQFTVNIALIRHRRPVAGFVYAPVKELLYYALDGKAYRVADHGAPVRLSPAAASPGDTLTVAGSLSHPTPEMDDFIAEQKTRYKEVRFLAMGSSLKMCLVAEGSADIYPRFGPTMEWDTAAAHAVVNGAGRKILRFDSSEELTYNKENLHNPWFVVK